MIQSFVVSNILYNLYDSGFANTLGLATLRHGTNPYSNLRIRIQGGDPKMGGSETGADGDKNPKLRENKFFVWRESPVDKTDVAPPIPVFLQCRLQSASSAFMSTAYSLRVRLKINEIASVIFGALLSLLSPTIRFRYASIPTEFKNDAQAPFEPIYETTQKIEAWRIGPFGSIITGINLNWFSRIKAKPLKVLTGVVQLVCAVALTVLCLKIILACPYAAVAGALLA